LSRIIEEKTEYSYSQFIESIQDFDQSYKDDISSEKYFGFPIKPTLEVEETLHSSKVKSIAYFSMEFGIAPSIYNSFQLTRPMSEKNQF